MYEWFSYAILNESLQRIAVYYVASRLHKQLELAEDYYGVASQLRKLLEINN